MDELAARLAEGSVVRARRATPSRVQRPGTCRGAPSRPRSTSLRPCVDGLPGEAEVVAYCRGPYCVYADDAVRLPAGSRALRAPARRRLPRVAPRRATRRAVRLTRGGAPMLLRPFLNDDDGVRQLPVRLSRRTTCSRSSIRTSTSSTPTSRRPRVIGSPIVAVFETHVQADHVSGLPALVERTGATAYLPGRRGRRVRRTTRLPTARRSSSATRS